MTDQPVVIPTLAIDKIRPQLLNGETVRIAEIDDSTDLEPITMSMDDFIALGADKLRFEIINGELVPLSPQSSLHSIIIRRLFRALDSFVVQSALGEVFPESSIATTDNPQWVRGARTPDIFFVSTAHYARYMANIPDGGAKPFIIVPELVIEVISPTDRPRTILKKVDRYLADGVLEVWLVYPEQEKVVIYTDATMDSPRILRMDDTLEGGDTLPGFTIAVKTLFES